MAANILDYLMWRGDIPESAIPFSEVDYAVFARLSYLPFEQLPLDVIGMTVKESCQHLLELPDLETKVFQKADPAFISAIEDSPRFCSLKIFSFVSRIETQTQAQFSALALELESGSLCICFRGTDNTLLGWKEDFNMSFVCPVRSQELALHYLETIGLTDERPMILTGHSKGGNLAVYAGSFCHPQLQGRILSVYNFDGPGFDGELLATSGYQNLCKRVSTYVPQSSVVGMMLGHEEKYTIVHSQKMGIFQHSLYTWDIQRNHFSCMETVTESSRVMNYALKAWLAGLTPEQREAFVDGVYQVMRETNAWTLRDLRTNWLSSAKSILRALSHLDPQTRESVAHGLGLLGKSTLEGLDYVHRKSGSEDVRNV